MGAGRPVGSRAEREQQWRDVLERWRQSGLSISAFCQAEGLNPPTFYKWRSEIQRRDKPPGAPAFLPVHMIGATSTPSVQQGVEILLANGRCLRVGPGFDRETLVQVVDLLDA